MLQIRPKKSCENNSPHSGGEKSKKHVFERKCGEFISHARILDFNLQVGIYSKYGIRRYHYYILVDEALTCQLC